MHAGVYMWRVATSPAWTMELPVSYACMHVCMYACMHVVYMHVCGAHECSSILPLYTYPSPWHLEIGHGLGRGAGRLT